MALDWLAAIVTNAQADLPGSPAVEYLTQRGVSLALAQQYGVGYADPARAVEAATEAWVRWARRYWTGRLVFPLYDTLGRPIGMQTRLLEEKAYHIFYAHPSDLHPYVFGLPQALPSIWATGYVVLVEGVFDALAVAPHAPCVVATLRAKPTRTLSLFLRRYARSVIALLDMDEPGREGGLAVLNGQQGYTVSLPSYPAHDPSSWVAAGGGAALRKLLAVTRL